MSNTRPRPFVLLILDGYGISFVKEGNAIAAAKKPNLDRLMQEYPMAAIKAGGIEVGLPWGEMGNSETGHQNIGSGRIIYQGLPRITMAIEDQSFFNNESFLKAIEHVKQNPEAALHIMGISSNGGIHGHIDHQIALLKLAAQHGIGDRVHVHAFLDGRDSPPEAAENFLNQLQQAMQETGAGRLASIVGRYYAMDRADNWDRTKQAYELLVRGEGQQFPTWREAAEVIYGGKLENTSELAPPMLIVPEGENPRLIQDGDAIIFTNYRPDRARQLMQAFTEPTFTHFPVEQWKNLVFVAMMEYEKDQKTWIAFPEEDIEYPLGRIFAEQGLKQLRVAEGEKFAHVTYFFNGGREEPYQGESQKEIPSLRVKDVSKNPEMKAKEVTEEVVGALQKDEFDVIVVNYANPDMVAHTGNFEATVKAIEIIDACVGEVVKTVLAEGGALLLTCDHGNAETVIDQLTHNNSTDHTNNPVPIIYIAPDNRQEPGKSAEIVEQLLLSPIGVLADVAPTVLEILQIQKPAQMTAQSLLTSLT